MIEKNKKSIKIFFDFVFNGLAQNSPFSFCTSVQSIDNEC